MTQTLLTTSEHAVSGISGILERFHAIPSPDLCSRLGYARSPLQLSTVQLRANIGMLAATTQTSLCYYKETLNGNFANALLSWSQFETLAGKPNVVNRGGQLSAAISLLK